MRMCLCIYWLGNVVWLDHQSTARALAGMSSSQPRQEEDTQEEQTTKSSSSQRPPPGSDEEPMEEGNMSWRALINNLVPLLHALLPLVDSIWYQWQQLLCAFSQECSSLKAVWTLSYVRYFGSLCANYAIPFHLRSILPILCSILGCRVNYALLQKVSKSKLFQIIWMRGIVKKSSYLKLFLFTFHVEFGFYPPFYFILFYQMMKTKSLIW